MPANAGTNAEPCLHTYILIGWEIEPPLLIHCLSLRVTPPYVPGEIPEAIGQLTRLTMLNLSSCNLTGESTSCIHALNNIGAKRFLNAVRLE